MRAPRDIRLLSGLTAALAGLLLVLLPVPGGGVAHADDGSAVTVRGRAGALDDFSNLEVTVHQTTNLRTQGVRVSWRGGAATDGAFGHHYLQIMQCRGDAATGPTPEQCQFGLSNVSGVGGRHTHLRVVGQDTDPRETRTGGFVPFRPVTGDPTETAYDTTYFNQFTTNEQPYTRTGADGAGETVFELQAGVDAPHLGCGAVETTGATPEPCWLVVVPRGAHDADGTTGENSRLQTSPLSASNWAQRLQVRLDFLPTGEYCPIGQPELPSYGSEMVADAMAAWRPTLCTSLGTTYGYLSDDEETGRGRAGAADADRGALGFVQDPVVPAEGSPPVVHAPVAVSGLTVAFTVDDLDGSPMSSLRLNARLVAKLLTSTYLRDVPDGAHQEHLAGNPESLTCDPEFLELNPAFEGWPCHYAPDALIVPSSHSDAFALLWRWLQADPEARAFLGGEPDDWGTRPNRYHVAGNLDEPPAARSFPKDDPTRAVPLGPSVPEDARYGVVDLRPYVSDLHAGATAARRADSGERLTWDPSRTPPGLVATGPDAIGRRFQLALTDAASASRLGLPTAQLPNADGRWTRPTEDALLAAVDAMADGPVPGVLAPEPTRARGAAYPLTTVTYAAASTAMSAEDRGAYAELISYVAGPGQRQGVGNGQLPPGYAPLPEELRETAADAARRLIAGPPADGDPGGASGGDAAAGSGSAGGGSAAGGGFGDASGGLAGGVGDAGGAGDGVDTGSAAGGDQGGPEAATDPPPGESGGGEADGEEENLARSGATTPETVLGIIRWVLLVALVTGVVGAVVGPLLARRGLVRPLPGTRHLREGKSLTS
ncbi:hypothetical protein [Streptomyces hainanensis]|uniref:PBP domain-containing protein n=1 Tax=Streptomyces hainanensis TaxID=402648 RepID=A0A4R4TEB0_9ACTN|nr:hypothetical protein [Streptomyces hainanensis]TDC74516.1 hypothetical protein E1283_15465 [Streptomyces hainanensis]